jgi:hypothetical protein
MESQHRSIPRRNILAQPLRAVFEAEGHSPSALIKAPINGFLHPE